MLKIENHLERLNFLGGLKSTVLRFSNPFGPRQIFSSNRGLVTTALEKVLWGKALQVMGDGDTVRDFVYVADVAHQAALLMQSQPSGFSYNLGSGQGKSVSEILRLIEVVTEQKVVVEPVPFPSTFVKVSEPSISMLRDQIGDLQFTPIEDGIRLTWEYLLEFSGNKRNLRD
jgi:UDP-glucose 4-epimerase